jgi:hypothetical protein
MVELHDRFATSAVLYMVVVGVWGIVSYFRKTEVSGSYRGVLIIGEGMLALEAVYGMALFATGHRPPSNLHFLYGALTPFVLPLSLTIAGTRPTRQGPLIYGVAALFIVGLALRAIVTG